MGNQQSTKNKNKNKTSSKSSTNEQKCWYVEGRRYTNYKNSKYFFPDDDIEIDRLQMQHYLFRHIFYGNFSAPVEDMLKRGGRILDIGCGPGTWVLENSCDFVRSEFYGIDIAPMFPSMIKPRNAHFIQANILDGLPFDDNYFDFVHLGFLSACFSEENWTTQVIPECIRVCKPNGWIEFYEGDGAAFNGGPCYIRVVESLRQEFSSMGLNLSAAILYKDWLLKEPNLTKVQEEVRKQSIGSCDSLAMIMEESLKILFKTLAPRLANNLEISLNEFDIMLQAVHEEYNKYGTYMNFHRVYAQKTSINEHVC
ncbi:12110_t:CDS:2 [Cetraspora pellucida]|uniref:12110_t:CDS:1 n=1 Tax=Cetraspora pellucida TaxID=1433469 RepID=A0A9N8ZDM2_9GLOM|nr:12110_t:CDS:2 [Cetraspora pellucida]